MSLLHHCLSYLRLILIKPLLATIHMFFHVWMALFIGYEAPKLFFQIRLSCIEWRSIFTCQVWVIGLFFDLICAARLLSVDIQLLYFHLARSLFEELSDAELSLFYAHGGHLVYPLSMLIKSLLPLALWLWFHESCLLTHHSNPSLVLLLAYRYFILLRLYFSRKSLISEPLFEESALLLDFIHCVSLHTDMISPHPLRIVFLEVVRVLIHSILFHVWICSQRKLGRDHWHVSSCMTTFKICLVLVRDVDIERL